MWHRNFFISVIHLRRRCVTTSCQAALLLSGYSSQRLSNLLGFTQGAKALKDLQRLGQIRSGLSEVTSLLVKPSIVRVHQSSLVFGLDLSKHSNAFLEVRRSNWLLKLS